MSTNKSIFIRSKEKPEVVLKEIEELLNVQFTRLEGTSSIKYGFRDDERWFGFVPETHESSITNPVFATYPYELLIELNKGSINHEVSYIREVFNRLRATGHYDLIAARDYVIMAEYDHETNTVIEHWQEFEERASYYAALYIDTDADMLVIKGKIERFLRVSLEERLRDGSPQYQYEDEQKGLTLARNWTYEHASTQSQLSPIDECRYVVYVEEIDAVDPWGKLPDLRQKYAQKLFEHLKALREYRLILTHDEDKADKVIIDQFTPEEKNNDDNR